MLDLWKHLVEKCPSHIQNNRTGRPVLTNVTHLKAEVLLSDNRDSYNGL